MFGQNVVYWGHNVKENAEHNIFLLHLVPCRDYNRDESHAICPHLKCGKTVKEKELFIYQPLSQNQQKKRPKYYFWGPLRAVLEFPEQ